MVFGMAWRFFFQAAYVIDNDSAASLALEGGVCTHLRGRFSPFSLYGWLLMLENRRIWYHPPSGITNTPFASAPLLPIDPQFEKHPESMPSGWFGKEVTLDEQLTLSFRLSMGYSSPACFLHFEPHYEKCLYAILKKILPFGDSLLASWRLPEIWKWIKPKQQPGQVVANSILKFCMKPTWKGLN